MRVVGLTGGIASGKSTVARMLAELGAQIVDADQVARQVVEPGEPAYHDLVAAFGREILLPEGGAGEAGEGGRGDSREESPSGMPRGLDRKKLGAMVFSDREKRKLLNAITHPRIAFATQQKLMALRAAGALVAVYEAALLVENGLHHGLSGLIVVACSEAEQIARVQRRDNLTQNEAVQRVRAQAPLSDKLAVATWVIDTSGPLDATRRQVEKLWAEIGGGERS